VFNSENFEVSNNNNINKTFKKKLLLFRIHDNDGGHMHLCVWYRPVLNLKNVHRFPIYDMLSGRQLLFEIRISKFIETRLK